MRATRGLKTKRGEQFCQEDLLGKRNVFPTGRVRVGLTPPTTCTTLAVGAREVYRRGKPSQVLEEQPRALAAFDSWQDIRFQSWSHGYPSLSLPLPPGGENQPSHPGLRWRTNELAPTGQLTVRVWYQGGTGDQHLLLPRLASSLTSQLRPRQQLWP